jgi:hypothetical protein
MKKITLFIVTVMLGLSGCITYYDPNPPTASEPISPPPTTYYMNTGNSESQNMVPVTMPNVTNPANVIYSTDSPKDSRNIEFGLQNTNWISPGKVTVDNLYLGAEADYILRIHNGSNDATIFQITVRQPDGTQNNKLPIDCMDWVTLSLKAVYVPAKTTYEMPIIVKMLKDTNMKGKSYEVWVSVIDSSQKGMVQTELCSRLIISTRR